MSVPSPLSTTLQKSSSGSNCDSFDSNHTTSSSDDIVGSDYESCNGNYEDRND